MKTKHDPRATEEPSLTRVGWAPPCSLLSACLPFLQVLTAGGRAVAVTDTKIVLHGFEQCLFFWLAACRLTRRGCAVVGQSLFPSPSREPKLKPKPVVGSRPTGAYSPARVLIARNSGGASVAVEVLPLL